MPDSCTRIHFLTMLQSKKWGRVALEAAAENNNESEGFGTKNK